ncbi:energy-coupling factor transport system permease protein [Sporomusaceae bacterium BoRhaA]|uniref:energy-coupling factor transporter transmembrane component T family protein n=1 Tax=Pelorhabdus rhamnosifermentans TaxID=2772457 RepID=UPI001C05FB9C|nr:energy-coupling factor transporter transmembrane component T [Pelorhabdus rhamnosifermentans]MBU2700044.1 energy-coupling factor transport system permease protein [Pelorhabdus rhamnosifermentans]
MSSYAVIARAGQKTALSEKHPVIIGVCCLSLIFAAFATINITNYLVMLGILAVVVVAGRIPAGNIIKIIGLVIPLCFFITLIQALTQGGTDIVSFMIGGYPVHLSERGVSLGLAIMLRVIILAVTMTVFFALVNPMRLTRALYDLGMPFKYAYAFTLALRFLPLIISEISTINNAQKCRGYDIDRCNFIVKTFKIIPLMTPLIIMCLRRSSSIALAMDLKAFGSITNRTFYLELKPATLGEKTVMVLSVIASFSFIITSTIL